MTFAGWNKHRAVPARTTFAGWNKHRAVPARTTFAGWNKHRAVPARTTFVGWNKHRAVPARTTSKHSSCRNSAELVPAYFLTDVSAFFSSANSAIQKVNVRNDSS